MNADRTYYPDDPLGETWSYEHGTVLVDPTGAAVGDYYGRLIAYYTEGGFVDEAGDFVAGYNLTFSHWEVLNEVNSEHHMSPAFYTILYDAIVTGIRKWAPRGSANMKFFGLGGAGSSYVEYFLNKSNHMSPSPPIDFISIHHYAGSRSRDGGPNASDYEAFFPSGDGFISELGGVYANIAAGDYPGVMVDADEVGVILLHVSIQTVMLARRAVAPRPAHCAPVRSSRVHARRPPHPRACRMHAPSRTSRADPPGPRPASDTTRRTMTRSTRRMPRASPRSTGMRLRPCTPTFSAARR